jgi:hypothetical protein
MEINVNDQTNAMILGQFKLPVDPMSISSVEDASRSDAHGAVEPFDGEDAAIAYWRFFEPFAKLSSRSLSVSDVWFGPHKDYVIGEVTIGLVLLGDHYLFVDDGDKIGDLLPGTMFAINNKNLHGAFCRENKEEPLVFLTLDLVCDWEEARSSLISIADDLAKCQNQ